MSTPDTQQACGRHIVNADEEYDCAMGGRHPKTIDRGRLVGILLLAGTPGSRKVPFRGLELSQPAGAARSDVPLAGSSLPHSMLTALLSLPIGPSPQRRRRLNRLLEEAALTSPPAWPITRFKLPFNLFPIKCRHIFTSSPLAELGGGAGKEDTKSGGDWLPEQPFLSSPGSGMLQGGTGFQQRQGHLSQGWDLATGSGRGPIERKGYEQSSAALDLL